MYFRKRKRLLFGAVDIGYRIQHYSSFIQETFNEELKAESFSKYVLPQSHFKTSYTFTCPVYEKGKLYVYSYTFLFFIRALFTYDILHFLSGETILPWKLRGFELFMYKLFRKKVIMHFVGSDIRSEKYLAEKNEYLVQYVNGKHEIQEPISSEIQNKLINQANKYADKILVSTPDLLQIFPNGLYIPVFIDKSNLPTVQMNKNEVITIFHSPSHFINKGSVYIQDALTRIKDMYKDGIKIEIPSPEKKNKAEYVSTRYEMFDQMQKAHIVVDQMVIGWFGLKSIEALAFNCEVMCYIDDLNLAYLENNCPIINVNVMNFENELINTIEKLKNRGLISTYENKLNYIAEIHSIHSYTKILKLLWLGK